MAESLKALNSNPGGPDQQSVAQVPVVTLVSTKKDT